MLVIAARQFRSCERVFSATGGGGFDYPSVNGVRH